MTRPKMVSCNVCKDRGGEFKAPWDEIGAELMKQHIADHIRAGHVKVRGAG